MGRRAGSSPVIHLPDDGEWMNQAVCIGVGMEVMFPEPGSGHPYHDQAAKALCAKCPVSAPCLEYALAWPEAADRYGIFGGMNPNDRRRERRRRRGLPPLRGPGRPPKPSESLDRIGEANRRAVERLRLRDGR